MQRFIYEPGKDEGEDRPPMVVGFVGEEDVGVIVEALTGPPESPPRGTRSLLTHEFFARFYRPLPDVDAEDELRAATDPPALEVGDLAIDVAGGVTIAGRPIELNDLERRLLVVLAAEPRRVFTRVELYRDVPALGAPARIDHVAHHLRQKLGPAFVGNIWGVGYRLIAVS